MGTKNLLGLPWRVALALQDDGWILRNAIIWHKPNAMPESVRDRLNCRYELIFLLVRSRHYWFDLDPIRLPHAAHPPAGRRALGRRQAHLPLPARAQRRAGTTRVPATSMRHATRPPKYGPHTRQVVAARRYGDGRRHAAHPNGRNPGDVWSIPPAPTEARTSPRSHRHPAALHRGRMQAGGIVLDPFCGTGTTGIAARRSAGGSPASNSTPPSRRSPPTGSGSRPEPRQQRRHAADRQRGHQPATGRPSPDLPASAHSALLTPPKTRPEHTITGPAAGPGRTPRRAQRPARRPGRCAWNCRTSHRSSHRKPPGPCCGSCSRRRARPTGEPADDAPERGALMTGQAIDLAFWGRVSTEDNQDPESSRGWQITRAKP